MREELRTAYGSSYKAVTNLARTKGVARTRTPFGCTYVQPKGVRVRATPLVRARFVTAL